MRASNDPPASNESPAAAVELVNVGKVGRAHGLAGAFFVSDRLEPVPKSYRELWIGTDAASAKASAILSTGMQGGRPLVKCDIASDRTAAEALIGMAVFVERARIKARSTGKDDLVWNDLFGIAVVDATGAELGIVEGLYNSGSSDVMVVRGPGGLIDLPLVDAYFDPSTVAAEGRVRLKVGAETFEGLWRAAPKA